MHIFKLMLALSTITITTNACKCIKDLSNDVTSTIYCCGEVGGSVNGQDCTADSISQSFSGFRKCCRRAQDISDCDGDRDFVFAKNRKCNEDGPREITSAGLIMTIN